MLMPTISYPYYRANFQAPKQYAAPKDDQAEPIVSHPYCRADFEGPKQLPTLEIDQEKTWSNTWESHCENVVVLDNCRWNILVSVANQCESRGHYDTAESVWFSALDTVAEFSLKDPRVLYTIERIGSLLFKAGETERAELFFIEHAKLTSTIFGDCHVKTADSLSRLGMVYYAQQSYPAAELCFRHALGVYLYDTGETSENVMRARESMAHTLRALGDVRGSSRQLNRALTVSFRLFGPNSPHTQNLSRQLASLSPCPEAV